MKKDLKVVTQPNGKKEYTLYSSKLKKELVFVGPLGEGGVAKTYKFQEKGTPGAFWVIKEYPKPENEVVRQAQINIRKNLQDLIAHPVSTVDDIIVPPVEVLDFPNSGTFGYVMKYVDLGQFVSVTKLMKSRQFPDSKVICTMGKNLSRFFVALNLGNGKSYKDINEGNIYLNPAKGEVRVIDNDNVGEPSIKTIQGTSQYRAPEIFTHNALPDRYTDRFQLASYLLRLFVGAFPMEGRFMMTYCKSHGSIYDNEVAKVVLGEKAVFIFNEQNVSNALPERGEHYKDAHKVQRELWMRLPPEVRNGLTRTFVDGLPYAKREDRTTPSNWLSIFESLSNTLVQCPGCGKWTFGSAEVCQLCGKKVPKEKCANCQELTPKSIERCVRCGKPHRTKQSAGVRCPSCGNDNPSNEVICKTCNNYMFTDCQKCGNRVKVTERTCPNCGNTQLWQRCGNQKCAKWYPHTMSACPICSFDPTRGEKCPQCGRSVLPGTTVCPQCGKQISSASGQSGTQTNQYQNMTQPNQNQNTAQPNQNQNTTQLNQAQNTTQTNQGQNTTQTNAASVQAGWTVGKTQLSVQCGYRTPDGQVNGEKTLTYTVGSGNVISGQNLSSRLPGNSLFCLRAAPATATVGLQNMTSHPAQIYKLQGGKRVAVEVINPNEVKAITDDDQVKFETLTVWIKKIDVTKP